MKVVFLVLLLLVPQQRPSSDIAADLRKLADELDPPAQSIVVADSLGLNAALLTAPNGSTIYLHPATYTPVVVARSVKLIGSLGATITTTTNTPALIVTAPDVTITGICVTGPNADELVVLLGDRATFTQNCVRGGGNTKRGIRPDGVDITIARNEITEIYRVGQDSQCIATWNSPGRLLIEDNLLECASENILFGGADPTIPGTISTDIIVRRNTIRKNPAWVGKGYNVKNLIETKSSRRLHIVDNVLEHNWKDAQVGYAILITPVNQGGTHLAAEVSDTLIENNIIRDTAACFQIARGGYILRGLVIRKNLCEATGVGSSRNILILGGPSDVALEFNTFRYQRQSEASWIYGYDGAVTNFRAVGNLVRVTGEYGICTQGNCNGRFWQSFFPGGVIEGNALEGFSTQSNLPGNVFLSASDPDPVGYGR